jgi:hypothetical protein
MDRAAQGAPEVFQQEMEDVHRFIAQGIAAEQAAREQQLKEKLEWVKTLKS